jgi:hypothetical protein
MKFVNCTCLMFFCLFYICEMKLKERSFNSTKTITQNTSLKNETQQGEVYSSDYTQSFPLRLFKMSGKRCNINRCFYPYGKCERNTCECFKGYLNRFDKKEAILCSYKMKSQLIAFLLEAFTLIGGDIYLEFYFYSALKGFTILFICLIFICKIPCKLCGARDMIDYTCMPCTCFKTGTLVICIFGIFTWEIADLIRIMSYKSLDNNNMPLDYFF